MTSKTDICNMALSRIKAKGINSFDENSESARNCRLVYDQALEMVLTAHDWTFARKYADLTILDSAEVPGWDYVYVLPSDCHTPREITERNNYGADQSLGSSDADVKFEECTVNGTRVIATSQEDANLKYTFKLVDINKFDHIAREALISKLASDLAMPLKGKLDLQQAWAGGFRNWIGEAKANNARRDNRPAKAKSTIISSRG